MTAPVQLFDLASRQAQWLSVRQAAVASNVANANAPGYQTRDVTPFEAEMAVAKVRLAATHPSHVGVPAGAAGAEERAEPTAEIVGGPVRLESELAKTGEIRAGMDMNTAIVAAFHRMTLMVSKG